MQMMLANDHLLLLGTRDESPMHGIQFFVGIS